MRWDPYQLRAGQDFNSFWTDRLKDGERKVLFLIGRGFDTRATAAPRCILGLGKVGALHGWILRYGNGQPEVENTQRRIEANVAAFREIFGGSLTEIEIKMRGAGNSYVTSRNTRTAVSRRDELAQYTDVIIEVSAMPRTVALTAIAQLIALLDEIAHKDINQFARRGCRECLRRPGAHLREPE